MSEVRSGMIIAGKYRLEGALARGGMGSVWEARHLTLDTRVAIKFIGPDVLRVQDARRRFEREAKAAAFLKSAHVVQIHDYGVEGDQPYLVMELLAGEDLGERLKRRERLTPRETSSIVTQVARALRRAAEAGIVHRDLKPSNVFIMGGDDDDELVKVLDFGIAKAPRLDPTEQTAVGAIIGSPRYMSPEQARASPLVDPRSDLWSLAVIAYRALTGRYPFDSNEMTDLIVRICTETATPPSALDPSLDPELDRFFERALARSPADRFQTAREMAAAFALAAGEPPTSMTSRSMIATFAPEGRLSSPSLEIQAPANRSPSPPIAAGPSPATSPRSTGAHRRITPPAFGSTRVSGQPTPVVIPPAPPAAAPDDQASSGRSSSPSVTLSEPAASRRSGMLPPPVSQPPDPVPPPEPELTLTRYPDMVAARTPSPPRRSVAPRVAASVAVVAALVGALVWLAPWQGSRVPTAASSSAAPPGASAPPATPPGPKDPGTANVPTEARPPAPAETNAPKAAPTVAPLQPSSAPRAPVRAPGPAKGTATGKRHPILGI